MIFFRVAAYLRYLIFSGHKKGHGIHSPFIFDLVSQVLRNKPDKNIVLCVEKLRKRMFSDARVIIKHDLGAGSFRKRKDKFVKVSDLVRDSSVARKYCIVLSAMAEKFGKPYIIELGTSLGISTMYMALSSSDSTIHTIEGCCETAKIAAENFEQAGIRNINLHMGPFDERLPEILDSYKTPGLVFIDGNHRREPLLNYFAMIAEKSDSNTVVIIDDICMSHEMRQAWNEIKVHTGVSVTIDIYRMGIVFFRKGMNSNDFIVRY